MMLPQPPNVPVPTLSSLISPEWAAVILTFVTLIGGWIGLTLKFGFNNLRLTVEASIAKAVDDLSGKIAEQFKLYMPRTECDIRCPLDREDIHERRRVSSTDTARGSRPQEDTEHEHGHRSRHRSDS